MNFGRTHYENVAYFNFETNPKLNKTFEENISPDYLIPILSHIAGQTIVREKTLIVFLRHTAYHKVLTVDSHCRIVEGSGHRRICLKASFDLLCQGLFAHGKHKFLHIHRVERLHVHLAHRK